VTTRPAAELPEVGVAKDGLRPARKGFAAGKSKACCGYPLVGEREWALRFYWMADQKRFEDQYDEQDVYTRDGYFLGTFPERFVRALRMEGTGRLTDGRVINYHGRCEYGVGTCYQTMNQETHPHGRGAGRRPLVPFKSVAIDPHLVPIGEPLYIPEFDGLRMPDGHIHDGCVRADDTGGSIKKRKMDFFVDSFGHFRMLLDRLQGVTWITPEIEHPRCQYLRRLQR
jgi:3D (Asp-Asp-Asp) domain-containing protein